MDNVTGQGISLDVTADQLPPLKGIFYNKDSDSDSDSSIDHLQTHRCYTSLSLSLSLSLSRATH